MSDHQVNPTWWQASDGKWYPPETYPGNRPPPPRIVVEPQSGSGLAVASLVLGLLWVGGLGSLLAVIFGAMALERLPRNHGSRGMAIAGVVLGVLGLIGGFGWLSMQVL